MNTLGRCVVGKRRTFISLSMRRVLVKISSVLSDKMSAGISSQVSSGGRSGVVSMAAASCAGSDAVVAGSLS
jgi:hypothetical protein